MPYVTAGQVIRSGPDPSRWDLTVTDSCGSTESGGYWLCVSDGEALQNNIQAEKHDSRGCTIAWYCYEHSAFEVP